ncbi:hypothetical protein LY76DRAFT_302208 [Colletotrichum caudatum]|nr:hypothetical protein LY76DRAFT_302208 [Colletotrichum caudatum]
MGIAEVAAISRTSRGRRQQKRCMQRRDGSTSHNSGMCHSFFFACTALSALINLVIACMSGFSSLYTA